MLIAELLLKKIYLEDKISELKQYLNKLSLAEPSKSKSSHYSVILSKLFDCLETLRTYKIILDEHNNTHTIYVGSSEIELASAVRLMETLEDKLELMASLINSGDLNINILDIMQQRDSLMEEYLLLVKTIKQSDWTNEIKST